MDRGTTSSAVRGILLFVSVWLLGAYGWHLAEAYLPWQDDLYKSLQLFGLNFDIDDQAREHIHPLLGVTRFVAPGLAVLALVSVLSNSFAANVRAARRVLTTTETALIVGYGAVGRAAARALRASRREARIVAIDRTILDSQRREARSNRIELFAADPLDRKTTERFPIRLSKADTVVVTSDDDAAAMSIAEALAARRTTLAGAWG